MNVKLKESKFITKREDKEISKSYCKYIRCVNLKMVLIKMWRKSKLKIFFSHKQI